MPVCSPYAVFRASDLAWSGPWAPPPSPSPSLPRKRLAAAAMIQGELFAFPLPVLKISCTGH